MSIPSPATWWTHWHQHRANSRARFAAVQANRTPGHRRAYTAMMGMICIGSPIAWLTGYIFLFIWALIIATALAALRWETEPGRRPSPTALAIIVLSYPAMGGALGLMDAVLAQRSGAHTHMQANLAALDTHRALLAQDAA